MVFLSVDFVIFVGGEVVGISARSLVMVWLNICSDVVILGISFGILDFGGIMSFFIVLLIFATNWSMFFLRSFRASGSKVK